MAIEPDVFRRVFDEWKRRLQQCIDQEGDYRETDRVVELFLHFSGRSPKANGLSAPPVNTGEEHRGQMIGWLDGMITTQMSAEISEMNKRAQGLKSQESYRTSKRITMRRYTLRKNSRRNARLTCE
jgi:hypothetical protein